MRPYALLGQKIELIKQAATNLDRQCAPRMECHSRFIQISVREIRSSRSIVHRRASPACGGEKMPIGVLGVREFRVRRAHDIYCIGCDRLQQLPARNDYRFARAQNEFQCMTECSRSTRASRRIATILSAPIRAKFRPEFDDPVGLLIAPKDALRLQFKTYDAAKPDGAISIPWFGRAHSVCVEVKAHRKPKSSKVKMACWSDKVVHSRILSLLKGGPAC